MNGHFVLKRDHSQDAIVKFGNRSPEAKTILLLGFTPNRIFQDLNAPFLFQIGTFAQDLVLEVGSELIGSHTLNDTAFPMESPYGMMPTRSEARQPETIYVPWKGKLSCYGEQRLHGREWPALIALGTSG